MTDNKKKAITFPKINVPKINIPVIKMPKIPDSQLEAFKRIDENLRKLRRLRGI